MSITAQQLSLKPEDIQTLGTQSQQKGKCLSQVWVSLLRQTIKVSWKTSCLLLPASVGSRETNFIKTTVDWRTGGCIFGEVGEGGWGPCREELNSWNYGQQPVFE